VQALAAQPITIYGNGAQTRSFCYVSDLVDGLMKLMDSPAEVTGPINIGNPVEFTIRELAEEVIRLTGSSSELIEMPLPHDDPKQRQPNITQARAKLGWDPSVPLAQGLPPTIEYFAGLTERG
jgi:UDP-glucuronate decarboxylase